MVKNQTGFEGPGAHKVLNYLKLLILNIMEEKPQGLPIQCFMQSLAQQER